MVNNNSPAKTTRNDHNIKQQSNSHNNYQPNKDLIYSKQSTLPLKSVASCNNTRPNIQQFPPLTMRSHLSMNNTSLSIIEDKNESMEEKSNILMNLPENQSLPLSELEPNTSSIFSATSLSKSSSN